MINYLNKQTNPFDRLKFIASFLTCTPENLPPITIAYFANATFDLCAEHQNFKLYAEILDRENYLDDNEKCKITTLLMFIVKKVITEFDSELNLCFDGVMKDVSIIVIFVNQITYY